MAEVDTSADAAAIAAPMQSGSAIGNIAVENSFLDAMEVSIESSSAVKNTPCAPSSSEVLADTPKLSMMARTAPNFVIPKNKALVPVTRTSKWEPIEDEPKRLSRKSKWGPDVTEDPAVKRGRALALQTRAEQLAAQLESNNLEIDNNEATRSPSPPPVYDALGHRMNTRELRKREQLDMERREAIGECMKLNPFYKPPAGYRPVPKEAKLFIPVKEYPGYNFIGLILGPRGITQKRLEADTGCKITIRGKGSLKEGKTPRHAKEVEGIHEDLHVHIAADTYEKLDAGIAIIEPLLIPVDEDRNIYRMKQLRELAEMNGTVRDFTKICTLCGEEGHREWQCPKDKLQTFQAKVICRLCGDASHPTFDCPLKNEGRTIDKEYLSFLRELGVGLDGLDPAAKGDADGRTEPMILTATGAHAMPASWSETEGNPRPAASGSGDDIAGFPRLPFPFPFPPPGSNPMNFLPRFFHPALLGLFRGRLPAPTLQMMAFMFSAFRGRLPFPPFGMRPDMMMMRPPVPPGEGFPPVIPADISMAEGQRQQVPESMAEGGVQTNPTGLLPMSGALSEGGDYGVIPAASSGEGPIPFSAFPSAPSSIHPANTPSFEATASSPLSTLPSTPALVPLPEMPPPPPPLPPPELRAIPPLPEMPPSGYPITHVPPPPLLPSFRPVPPVRPVVPPSAPSPAFAPGGGLGLDHPAPIPPWAGASHSSSLYSEDNLSKPGQMWVGSTNESTSSLLLVKPSLGYPESNPIASTSCPLLDRNTLPYSSLNGGPASVTTKPPLGGPGLVPHPFGMPTVPSDFTSPSVHGLFAVPSSNQPPGHFSGYCTPVGGASFQVRSPSPLPAAPSLSDYPSSACLSHQRPAGGMGLHAQDMFSRGLMTRLPSHYGALVSSELSYGRSQEPAYPHMELQNDHMSRAGSMWQSDSSHDNLGFRGPSLSALPSRSFDNYSYEPSVSLASLQQHHVGTGNGAWNGNMPVGGGRGGSWGQPDAGAGHWSSRFPYP